MIKIIFMSLLVVSIACPIFAQNNDTRSRGNAITLYNDTPLYIGYVFSNTSRGLGLYSIEPGGTDIYHSGFGDKRARLNLNACTERSSNGITCLTFISNIIPQTYNAELISTIRIKSLYEIEVTCLDGSSYSCLVD